jgi:hypothetical protein
MRILFYFVLAIFIAIRRAAAVESMDLIAGESRRIGSDCRRRTHTTKAEQEQEEGRNKSWILREAQSVAVAKQNKNYYGVHVFVCCCAR